MFRAIVLAPEPEFGRAVERLAYDSQHLVVTKTIPSLAESPYEVGRIISGYDPEVILVENTRPDAAFRTVEGLRRHAPDVAVLALGGRMSDDGIERLRSTGAAVLSAAFTPYQFITAIKQAIHQARRNTFGPLFAFLPGKAGSGATTIAFNLATATACGLEKKVFVLEADLHSGVMSALMNIAPRLPLIDALQNSDNLDYSLWLKYIVTQHGTDFLLADRVKKAPLPSWMHYHQLLRFASTRYDAMFVDLPEVVNEATDEIVQYAQCTFVVCTPELTSLKLAEQRLHELKAHGAPPDKLRVILNRWHRSDMKPAEVAELLDCPIPVVIRNDYRTISRAIAGSRPVGLDSELGRSFLEFGKKLVGSAPAETKPRFAFFG
jgi:pilus assembly protein CpaE